MNKATLFGTLLLGCIFTGAGAAQSGNGIEPRSDRLLAFLLLGADYRAQKFEETPLKSEDRYWIAINQQPLTFHRKSDDTTVVVEDKGKCLTTLTYTSKDKTGATVTKTIEVSPDQASDFELYDSGVGYWWLRGKGAAFWCEKVTKSGMSFSNCDLLTRDGQDRFLVPLDGGADPKAIVAAADFQLPRGCFAR